MIGGSLNISLSLGCNSIRCHFSIRMCFRLGTDGLYCVTKGNICLRTLVFSPIDIFRQRSVITRGNKSHQQKCTRVILRSVRENTPNLWGKLLSNSLRHQETLVTLHHYCPMRYYHSRSPITGS